ncbi:MAG TPA: hypothetical protein VF669_12565 [Tepidisphaeraceae bacterium]|jgi:fatty acid desaturase
MSSPPPQDQPPQVEAEPWFREPSVREHRIAAALFIGFGVFFILLFVVLSGWWFRWIIIALGVYSILHGARHAISSFRKGS